MKTLPIFLTLFTWSLAWATDPAATQLEVRPDKTQIGLDESISIKFSIRSEKPVTVEAPKYNAVGLSTINEYSSVFSESYFENGKFGARFNQQVTKILKPEKTGTLQIKDITVKIDGKVYAANPITIYVQGAGAGTPPPRGYGANSGVGLKGNRNKSANNFFVRAELDKMSAFKGEQVIVSYYLYRRVRVFNVQVTKFPVLNSFLREDLEMPVMQAPATIASERVTVDGVPYERSLLVRYAAYPLKDGKLIIDSLGIKTNFYISLGDDDEDPFSTFFQQLAPRQTSSQSEPISVDVKPLPTDGRPASFTGGVGDFNLTTAVDKYEVRANEALNFTLKVEGKGNVAAIEGPQVNWPKDVEVYESKNRSKSGQGGVGYKIFEYLLIPRATGKFSLPSMELSFFDPTTQRYQTRKTNPIEINVNGLMPGSTLGTGQTSGAAIATSPKEDRNKTFEDLRYLQPPGTSAAELSNNGGLAALIQRSGLLGFYLLGMAGIAGFGLLVMSDWMRGRQDLRALENLKRSKAYQQSWEKLLKLADAASKGGNFKDVTEAYDLLTETLNDRIDEIYGVGARSFSRRDLGEMLTQTHGMPENLWQRLSALFEFSETVQFASQVGGVSESSARSQLSKWVMEGKSIEEQLSSHKTFALSSQEPKPS
ncbi:BatD family protein [bacterium]|nr:BatD family protein [bacterium]